MCPAVAVQSCTEWIPIFKKKLLRNSKQELAGSHKWFDIKHAGSWDKDYSSYFSWNKTRNKKDTVLANDNVLRLLIQHYNQLSKMGVQEL